MPVHPVAAGTLEIDEPHLFPRQTEESGKCCTVAMRALRCSPNRRRISAHIGYGAGRAERGVALHWPEVASSNRLCTLRAGRVWCGLVDQDFVSDIGSAAQRCRKRVLFGQARPRAPLRTKRARSAHRHPLVGGNNREKVLDAHDLRAEVFGCRFVNRDELGADRRGPDHSGVQHSRNSEIVNVNVAARAFGRHVRSWERLADNDVTGGIFERRFRINFEVEAALSDQVCKGDAGPTHLRPYLSINRDEIIGFGTEVLCREFAKRFARRRGSLPDLHATALDTTRTGGPPLIRGDSRIALHILDLVNADPEFLGRHLSDSDPQALSEINFAAEYRHRAIAIHSKKGVHLLCIEDAWRTTAILCEKISALAAQCKGDGECATLENGTAREMRRLHREGHVSLPGPMLP